MARSPSVSVALAVRDRPEQLALCLHTLQAQRDADFELVVVDDASLPPTAALLRGLKPRMPYALVRREVSTGRAAARNAGWRAASGDVVVFIDGDILALPSLVAAHRAAHARHAEVAVLCVSGFPWSWQTVETVAFPEGRPLIGPAEAEALVARVRAPEPARWLEREAAPFLACVTRDVSVRRDVLAACGGLWEGFHRYGLADWELGYRLHRAGARFLAEPAAACVHQAHPAGPGRHRDNAFNYRLFLGRHADAEVALMALCPPWIDQAGYAGLCRGLHRLAAVAPPVAKALPPALLGYAHAWAARGVREPGAAPAPPALPPPRGAEESLARWRAARDPAAAALLAACAAPRY